MAPEDERTTRKKFDVGILENQPNGTHVAVVETDQYPEHDLKYSLLRDNSSDFYINKTTVSCYTMQKTIPS